MMCFQGVYPKPVMLERDWTVKKEANIRNLM